MNYYKRKLEMKYKAVIFDLDGTLVDTLRDLADSVNYVLGQLSLPTHSVDSYKWRVGDGARMMILRSLPENKQAMLDKVLPLQQAYYGEHYCDTSRPYPGVVEVVNDLKKQGFRLAVLSNKPDGHTREIVSQLFGPDMFDLVTGKREDMTLKPDPTSALWVAEQLGAAPKEIVYVGDTKVDMQTAKNAGMLAVGVTWGFRGRQELIENGADVLIDRAEQLVDLVVSGSGKPTGGI
jgi:phosphoglycolate phosphatase